MKENQAILKRQNYNIRFKNDDMTRQYFVVHVKYNQELPADFWSVEAAEKRIKK